MNTILFRLGALGLALALGGCLEADPFEHAGTWQPTGVNAANLGAMVADRNDLARGRAAPRRGDPRAAEAVVQLWHGKPVALNGQGDISGIAGGGGGK